MLCSSLGKKTCDHHLQCEVSQRDEKGAKEGVVALQVHVIPDHHYHHHHSHFYFHERLRKDLKMI